MEYDRDSLFIRILYNGEDRTGDLSFCKKKNRGLCSTRDFDRFVSEELFDIAGMKSLDELCRLEL